MTHLKKFNKFIHILCAIGVALNTVMLVHNVVNDNNGWAFINFLSGLFLLISYEKGRNKNDE